MSRGIALAAVAAAAVLLSGCGQLYSSSWTPPVLQGYTSCAPAYPGFYVWPPHNACYPGWDFPTGNRWF
jgi:hypothetical protein